MRLSLKIASPAAPPSTRSTYIRAGQAKRQGHFIEVRVERHPTQELKMYLYGDASHRFPKGMRAKRILTTDGQVIGKAAVTPHQKALVLHLEALTDQFVIEMVRVQPRKA